MPLAALTAAPVAIQLHAAAATLAFALGPFALLRARRDAWHRAAGYIWFALMLTAALSSLFISETPMIGPFSPIHALSFVTLGGLAFALKAALRRDFIAHGRAMRALYAQALIIAGVFTFLPGRRMNALVGGEPMAVFWAAAICGAAIMAVIWFHGGLSRAIHIRRKIPLFIARPFR